MNTCGSSHFLGQRELISDAFLGGVLLTLGGGCTTWTYIQSYLHFGCNLLFIGYQNQAETVLSLFFFGCDGRIDFVVFFLLNREIVRQGSCFPGVINCLTT